MGLGYLNGCVVLDGYAEGFAVYGYAGVLKLLGSITEVDTVGLYRKKNGGVYGNSELLAGGMEYAVGVAACVLLNYLSLAVVAEYGEGKVICKLSRLLSVGEDSVCVGLGLGRDTVLPEYLGKRGGGIGGSRGERGLFKGNDGGIIYRYVAYVGKLGVLCGKRYRFTVYRYLAGGVARYLIALDDGFALTVFKNGVNRCIVIGVYLATEAYGIAVKEEVCLICGKGAFVGRQGSAVGGEGLYSLSFQVSVEVEGLQLHNGNARISCGEGTDEIAA